MNARNLRTPIAQAVTCVSRSRLRSSAVHQYSSAYAVSLRKQIKPAQSLICKRWQSSSSDKPRQYNFEDVRSFTGSPSDERVIIDVREPAEYQAGYIPGAINIPVKSQPDAIFMPEEEFEDKFGFNKPSQEQEIVFYCRAGVRSSAAAQLAQQQGYKNISEYRGSWLDWEKNGGPIAKP